MNDPQSQTGPRNGVGSGELVLLDDDRTPTRAGDTVCFHYGIPPIGVRAKIIQRGRALIALTPGHTPPECTLRTLRRHVGGWVKQNGEYEPQARRSIPDESPQ